MIKRRKNIQKRTTQLRRTKLYSGELTYYNKTFYIEHFIRRRENKFAIITINISNIDKGKQQKIDFKFKLKSIKKNKN